MGKKFQKSGLPAVFHFVGIKAAFQPHAACDQHGKMMKYGFEIDYT